jgi:hypothetical protein
LTDAELDGVKAHGLFNLSDFLPKKPGDVELKVIKEMFQASVDGEPFDKDAWGQYFRPAGMGQVTGDPNKSTSGPVVDHNIDPDEPTPRVSAPVQSAPKADTATAPASGSGRAEDILAMIRNRQKQ